MDGVLGFLGNPAFLTVAGIAWGLLVKYHPKWKGVPNAIIPYATAIVAFLTQLAGPAEAHAGTLYVLAIPFGKIGGFFGPVVAAGWQAIQNALIYEVFLRSPVQDGLGWRNQARIS